MRLAPLLLLLAVPLLPARADEAAQAYRVESTALLKLNKGQKMSAHVEVVPLRGAHVSPDAPISLTVASGGAVQLAQQKFARADAHETQAKGVEFALPLTGEARGKDEVKGTLSFFICTEKLCERQKKEIAIPVEVQ